MAGLYDRYVPILTPRSDSYDKSLIFVADSLNLLVKGEGNYIVFPDAKDFKADITRLDRTEYLGTLDGSHCFCLSFDTDITIPQGFEFKNLREILGIIDEDLSLLAMRALHIANWSKNNRFCGVCGNRLESSATERAKVCKSCGNTIYPRISPAIIIAVIKDGRLLLAHNKRFPGNWHSVLAGFMEPGENFEDTAKREVFEEVGIRIKNVRYFGSQPWPFPDSLMIGLTAEYESGELMPDGDEIDKADWFSAGELPDYPGTFSIAGRLIEWFSKGRQI